MNCGAVKDRLVDYLYGELPADERSAFEAHLAGCESCRGEVEGLGSTLLAARTAVQATLEEGPPAHVRSAALAAVREGAATAGPLATEVTAAPMATPAKATRTVGPMATPAEGAVAGLEVRAPVTKPQVAAAQPAPVGERLRAWWRRPWLIPAFAAATAMVFFVFVRQVITESPTTAPPSVGELQGPAEGSRLQEALAKKTEELPPGSVGREDSPAAGSAPSNLMAQPRFAPPPPSAVSPAPRADLDRVSAAASPKRRIAASRSRAAEPSPMYRLERKQDLDDSASGIDQGGARGGLGAGASAGLLAGTRAKAKAPAQAAAAEKEGAAHARMAFDEERERARPAGEHARAVAAPPSVSVASPTAEWAVAAPAAAARPSVSNDAASFDELVKRAEHLFSSEKWAESAAAYRALVRRFPEHKNVPVWKGRVRACEEALAR